MKFDLSGIFIWNKRGSEIEKKWFCNFYVILGNQNNIYVTGIIGDIKDKNAIIVDDIIDTAGTITSAAKVLKEKGAKDVYIVATHAIFSGPAVERLKDDSIKEIIVTNSIQLPKEKTFSKLKIISLASLLAESIKRIYEGEPMGVLFDGLYDKIKNKRGK